MGADLTKQVVDLTKQVASLTKRLEAGGGADLTKRELHLKRQDEFKEVVARHPGKNYPTGDARMTAIHKEWAEIRGRPYVPRKPPIGTVLPSVDTADPENEETAERDSEEDARDKRGQGIGRARMG